ncbi:hypothetical protein ABEB36_005583 [Hypothenemus hampei]|uniref:Uncharacterized protein n=1 Tax=Hypothenemus hampei TaxID=57062 RepID=A0ABD1EZ43_HYPHA
MSETRSIEDKPKNLGKVLRGTVQNLVKNISKDRENKQGNSEQSGKNVKSPKKDHVHQYLSKSVECLSTPTTPELNGQIRLTMSDPVLRHAKSCMSLIETSGPGDSVSESSEDVELRKPKSSNFRKVLNKSVRGSIKLVRGLAPKSDNDNKEKRFSSDKYTMLKQLTTSILDQTQPPASLYLQPPAPLVVEDPPSTDDELHDLRNQNPAFLNG